jgi:iron complex outermembrane receptor protein
VIRRAASASPGAAATIGVGSQDPLVADVRYGGARRDRFQYRLSGRAALRRSQASDLGFDYDDGRFWRAGARGDWQTDRGDLTVQGDVYRTVIGQRDSLVSYAPPSREQLTSDDLLSGGNVMVRWQGRGGIRAPRLQWFYDHTARSELTFRGSEHTVDMDYQQGALRGPHGLLWGGGYRVVVGSTDTRGSLRFYPPDRTDQLLSGFLQDEVRLVSGRLRLTVGAKIEHNDYSGLEWQPSARLLWTVTPANAVSISVARAVRTPSRVERDFESGNLLSPSGPTFVRLNPNPDFESEELVAYEAGLVSMPHPKVMATVAVFRNQHDRVMSTELGSPFAEGEGEAARVIVPVTFANGLRGRSYGIEATVDLRPTRWWSSTASYSALRVELSKRPGSADITQESRAEGGSPRHQVQVTTAVQLPGRVEVGWFLRSRSALPDLDLAGYATSNVHVEWVMRDGWRLFVTGRNLHQASHAEFDDGANGTFEVRRSVLVGLRVSLPR